MKAPTKCPVPGCGGTEFYSTTTDGGRRPVYSFTRERGKIKRHDIGDAVVCTRCDSPLIVTDVETYLTQRAMKALGADPVRLRPMGSPKEEPHRPTAPTPVMLEP